MIVKAISNLNLLKVFDETTLKTYYGCNQEWYGTERRRLSGCGPSAAATIICYLNHTRSVVGLRQSFNSKKSCLLLMEEVWEYVTPTSEGISTTKMLFNAVLSYMKAKGFNVEYGFFDLTKDKSRRPAILKVINFIEEALLKDTPVAFLNLCNGDVKNLDSWHWITIVSLEYTEDRNNVFVTVLDRGQVKKIDLALWYNTTMLGGGFVYFTTSSSVDVVKY
ncbi:MAG: hypothetical protein H6Q66_3021 [Firmicutes bacterium]|nr:hypothetical protein [Bacillota bacterium]